MFQQIRDQLARLRQRELLLLFPMLVAIAGVWCFIEVADEVREGDTKWFDERLIRAFRRNDDPAIPIGPKWLLQAAQDISALGGVAVLVLMICIICGYLVIQRKKGGFWLVIIASISGLLLSTFLKHVFHRDRPIVVPPLAEVTSASFPSGHSMMSAVIYLTLGVLVAKIVARQRAKIYFIVVALLLTFLVGGTRIYLGVHYPTDVLAGWAAGLAWALICLLMAQYLQQRGVVEDAEDSKAESG